MLKNKLRSIMNTKYDDYFIMFLIIVSLILLPLETLDIAPDQMNLLKTIDKIIIFIFTIEYMIRFYLDRWKFSFSIVGVIDFVTIAPYYLILCMGWQNVGALGLFRLFRMLKFVRYTSAFERFGKAMRIAKDELILFSFIVVGILYFSSLGIYHFEHASNPEMYSDIFRSIWWSVITLTTIGYGDIYPVTTGGQLLTMLLALVGLGIITIPTSIITSALTEVRNEERGE